MKPATDFGPQAPHQPVLAVLRRSKRAMSADELATAAELDPAKVTRALHAMETRGLVLGVRRMLGGRAGARVYWSLTGRGTPPEAQP